MEEMAQGTAIDTANRAKIETEVIRIVAKSLDCPASEVRLQSQFWGDLGAESLDMLDIVYGLERAFHIRLPRLNTLHRAMELFGEETVIKDGVVTETGLALMRLSMPEVAPEQIRPGMRLLDFRRLITVESFVRLVEQCQQGKRELRCAACGGETAPGEAGEMMLRCTGCGAAIDLPSGEHLLVDNLLRHGRELGLPLRAQVSEST